MPAKKKPDRVRRNVPKVVDLAEYQQRETPKPPYTLVYKASKEWWAQFWQSKVSTLATTESDYQAVARLATLYELAEQASRSVRKNPLVKGSQGQWVENPLGKSMSRYHAEIRQLEDRFGLSPRSRMALNISFGQAHRELEELLDRTTDSDEPAEDQPDFRDVIDI